MSEPLAFEPSTYEPVDQMALWWLGQPSAPTLVGTLETARQWRGVSMSYAPAWLKQGFALSEDLPLQARVFMPDEKDQAVGAVDDARPDRWGERVIRFIDRPKRMSLLEYLLFAGDERFGALGVSLSAEQYAPRRSGPLPELADVQAVASTVQRVLNGEHVPPALQRMITPGATLGGARPKALLNIDGHPWVVKFAEAGEFADMPLLEHAAMTLAARAGIRVAPTQALPLQRGHAVAVRRFDREAGGRRRHALSAHVALRAAGEEMGYPELAQLLRRKGVADGGLLHQQMHELFKRMVFNILIDNTDDHEKNHVLLVTHRGDYELAPAFDVLPSGQALGYQQMRVGQHGSESNLENALSESRQFGLGRQEAVTEIRAVVQVVQGWQAHFLSVGLSDSDMALLAQQIDRPALLDQRGAFL